MDVDVVMDILCRLPVGSLVRFKSVSKFWMTLISDPYFKTKHFNRSRNDENSQKILVNCHTMKSWYCYTYDLSLYGSVQQVEQVQQLDCPSKGKPWRRTLYCCCDGLALMGVFNYQPPKLGCPSKLQLLLWNPSTRESILLPNPESFPRDNCTWGLGYDSTSDDYMILKIDDKSEGEILALKSGSWRLMDKHHMEIRPRLTSTDSLAFVHGAFHWLISSSTKYSVMSFSISNEVYREILLPEQMSSILSWQFGQGVSVLGGMLCAYSHLVFDTENIYKFWVMKDYVNGSWTELVTIQGTDLHSVIPKYMFSDGEVLMSCMHLNHRARVFRTSKGPFGSQDESDAVQQGFVYTESLILPKLRTRQSLHFCFKRLLLLEIQDTYNINC